MNEKEIRAALSDLPLGGVQVHECIDSTNDTAVDWAARGAPDLSLVYAEQQSHGRGRGSRAWETVPGVSLAFSLILHPRDGEESIIQRFTALGALAVCQAVEAFQIQPEIKWPNDVLINGKKFCGILVEVTWMLEKIEHIVLGIGVNVGLGSVPQDLDLNFPATCLEGELGRPVDRIKLLHGILAELLSCRPGISSFKFLNEWENHLAFRGEMVAITGGGAAERTGRIDGLDEDGSLRLRSQEEGLISIQLGEIHLHPVV